jgi:hypothetical protein
MKPVLFIYAVVAAEAAVEGVEIVAPVLFISVPVRVGFPELVAVYVYDVAPGLDVNTTVHAVGLVEVTDVSVGLAKGTTNVLSVGFVPEKTGTIVPAG